MRIARATGSTSTSFATRHTATANAEGLVVWNDLGVQPGIIYRYQATATPPGGAVSPPSGIYSVFVHHPPLPTP